MNYLKLFGIATFAIGAILYLASADDHDIVVGEQDFNLDEYSKISVNLATNLKVKVGSEYNLNVTGDQKNLQNIKVYVKGQTLVIENKKGFYNGRDGNKVNIEISLPLLKKFTLNGASKAIITGVHGNLFRVVVNGSGYVDFKGSVDDFRAEVNGSGYLISSSFLVQEGNLDINGSGKASLTGNCETLDVNINGSGNFDGKDFKCDEVNVDISGSGDTQVYARKKIDLDVMGSGGVDVYGKPSRVRDRSDKKNHITLK